MDCCSTGHCALAEGFRPAVGGVKQSSTGEMGAVGVKLGSSGGEECERVMNAGGEAGEAGMLERKGVLNARRAGPSNGLGDALFGDTENERVLLVDGVAGEEGCGREEGPASAGWSACEGSGVAERRRTKM